MSERGTRFEDLGLARILKYLPLIVLIFTSGAWYESAQANKILAEKLQTKEDNHEYRLTKVEDAIVYLTQIVKDDRSDWHR